MVKARDDDATAAMGEHELRSAAQLRFLHTLALQLNALDRVGLIGEAITNELKTLIDYHNCRIYLLKPDGSTLVPLVFRGELTEYEGETYEELVTEVGEGITGHAALTGETHYAPDALRDPFGVQIEGTSEIDESILAVPMKVGDRVNGVIVLSNLGVDRFDEEDIRLLEVLASHAAVAFDNARLLQREREAAETASALLGLSQALTGTHDTTRVIERVVAAVPSLIPTSVAAVYLRESETGTFRLLAQRGAPPEVAAGALDIPAEMAATMLASLSEPFVLSRDVVADVPRSYRLFEDPREVMVAPLRWEPDGFAGLIVAALTPETTFGDHDLSLAGGIGDIASLALGSARRVHELERFHELVESLEAVFWEADPESLEFAFMSRHAALMMGPAEETVGGTPRRWGDHVHPDDRPRALQELREAIAAPGEDRNLEYRALGQEGETLWLRDLVHVAMDARGARQLRGLIVDITGRKRAEQALRRSERKYLEAFRREREATQRLRVLDDMKNTFLEAVSHDLRTPLTSILGSALTLEKRGLDLPREDALDLLRRIAANARKLERLLSDLLDLDRLQRGIVSPQRRPTDVGELVAQTIDEFDLLNGRKIEVDAPSTVTNVDAAKVERIVENLLVNAVRHTPADSHLWVRVIDERDGVLIVIEDEGPGVPDRLKEAVFEPFRQGPGPASVSPGVGIGLSLVARFAELHGGAAWVEDRPGGGASFRVYLPGA